jgi:flagellar biosynthetic protein FliP
MTSFTRLIIVLAFLRNALGIHQLPPNQVLIGFALFLTAFIMAPVWKQINEEAVKPYMSGKIDQIQAIEKGLGPLRDFMFRQTREKDLSLFVKLSGIGRPRDESDVPTYVLVPAFIISELKTAFEMGFLIYVPFLVIDMVVSSVLMAMGMLMVPPMLVSLPFKILLFVMVDGWHILTRSLALSFR